MYSTPTQICSGQPNPSFPDGVIPFAPLITAKIIDTNIIVRSILFVDSTVRSVSIPPEVIINGVLQQNPMLEANKLVYYFTYNFPEVQATSYNTWYVEQSYPYHEEITDVEVYLFDTDPVRSRGTRTTVQQS